MKEQLAESLRRYVKVASYAKDITESKCNRPVPEQTFEAWKLTMVALHFADYKIDGLQDKAERSRQINKGLDFLNRRREIYQSGDVSLDFSIHRLRQSLDNFDHHRRHQFLRNLRLVCKVTEDIKEAEDIESFTGLTRLEGQLTSKLFVSLLPDDFKKRRNFSRYVKLMSRIGRFGNVFDTFVDLPNDYMAGQAKIEPTWPNRLRILRQTVGDGSSAFIMSSNPRFIFKFARAAFGTTKGSKL